jgi:rhodanese-related sulfurtransferase
MVGLRVSAEDVKRLHSQGDSLVVLDVRAPESWASSNRQAAGAIRLPLTDFDAHAGELPRHAELVAYCT